MAVVSPPTTEVATNGSTVSSSKPGAKPTRTKITTVGTLAANPRLVSPQSVGLEGGSAVGNKSAAVAQLVELLFDSVMNTNLPKGLPNLGGVKVLAYCNLKQWNKIQGGLHTASRLVVEGEVAAALNEEDYEPYLRLMVTRMINPELEKSRVTP